MANSRLICSTVFTLFLMPALFSRRLNARAAVVRRWETLAGKSEPSPAESSDD